MPSRYILATTLQNIEAKFGLPPQSQSFEPNYNISAGQYVPVITDSKPHEISFMRFGFTPFWAREDMLIVNARAEGDSNLTDDEWYKGAKGIIQKKSFRKPIRSQRCIVIASAFLEGITNSAQGKPYVVYLRKQQNPFPIAGIWDSWLCPQTGETILSFCIITTTANSLLRKIGSSRMPVILTYSQARKWINPGTGLSTITGMLGKYDSDLMNAYPADAAIKNSFTNNKQLVRPMGSKVLKEETQPTRTYNQDHGNYHLKKHFSSNTPASTLADWASNSDTGKVTW